MLSKTSKSVVNALVELAKLPAGSYEGASSIAKRIEAPKNYLGKLLQSLCARNIVSSKKGTGGGFRLGMEPDKITLYDIVEPIENVAMWEKCALGLKECSETDPCPVHDDWKVIKEAYLSFLRTTTVADLIKEH